jgi:hypothetical protein
MDISSVQTLQVIRRTAEARLRQMSDTFQMLMSSLPNLRAAFDPDELPVEFILRRDSRAAPVGRNVEPVSLAERSTSRIMSAHDVEHRRGQRMPVSHE